MFIKNFNKLIFKNFFIILSFFIYLFLFKISFALDIPKLDKYVNDFTNTLSNNQKIEIEKQLSDFDKQTSNQIVVLIIDSLNNEYSIEDYSLKVAELNKIGTKENDNGILFTIIKNDRKLRIEVGYGLEGFLTDAKSSYIIRNIITPEFKNENYYLGIKNGVNEIIKTSSDANYLNNKTNDNSTEKYSGLFGLIFIVIFLFLFIKFKWFREFILWMIIFGGGKGNGGRGGGFGGGGGFSGGGGSFGGGGSSGKW